MLPRVVSLPNGFAILPYQVAYLIAVPFFFPQSGTALMDGVLPVGSFNGGVYVNGHNPTTRQLDTASYLEGSRGFILPISIDFTTKSSYETLENSRH